MELDDFKAAIRTTCGAERADAQRVYADFLEEGGDSGAAATMRYYAEQPSYQTCLHLEGGLCPKCQEDYEGDPDSWIEVGCYPEGEAAWKSFLEEVIADQKRELEAWEEEMRSWKPGRRK